MLRNSVALSAVTGRAVRVINIRGARPQPGLRPQHLMAVRAVASVCGAKLLGDEIGSREIEFQPRDLTSVLGLRLDVGTAGSVLLVLQSLLPALVFAPAPSELTLIGGTDVPFAPPYEHLTQIFLPALAELNLHVEAALIRRGFYPKGGGEVHITAGQERVSCPIRSFAWRDRGDVISIKGKSYSQGLPAHIAERMREAALNVLQERAKDIFLPHADIELEIVPKGPSEGCGLALWAECEGGRRFAGSSLGRRGKRAEEVGREAAHELLQELESGVAIENHLADQLIVWMALADGLSEFTTRRLTEHLRNAVIVAEAMTGAHFTLEEGKTSRVHCEPANAGRGNTP